MEFETPLASDENAAAVARRFLDGWLNEAVGVATGDAIRLATSELVTNAVRHGGLRPDDVVGLFVDVNRTTVRVDVEQPTSTTDAEIAESPGARGPGGFGLKIVSAVTDRWGVVAGKPGRVWFEVGLSH